MKPICFQPIYQVRAWGGRALATQLGRHLPSDQPIGESWELCDRPEAQTCVKDGLFTGQSLHQLWNEQRETLFGQGYTHPHFPLLIKILDAKERLSIQVHPPASIAPTLHGEPKNEMWYVAQAEPHSKLYIGLKKGSSRERFEQAILNGSVEDEVHALTPKAGDFIYVPSGRLHAIGAGLLIYEIQQNSDTTYRVFDWNRVGLDGKPRDLHVAASLACIDFSDQEPCLDQAHGDIITQCEEFIVRRQHFAQGERIHLPNPEYFAVLTVIDGSVSWPGTELHAGDFALLPRGCDAITASSACTVLLSTANPS